MKLIYIFYTLIVEDKSKELKMHGPFIHHKPESDKIGWPAYVFNKDDFNEERKFLSKFLRTKNPSKISTFHHIEIDEPEIEFKCKCGHQMNLHITECGNDFVCSSCNTNDSLDELIEIGFSAKESALLQAYEHFEKHFKRMEENYKICNRKR